MLSGVLAAFLIVASASGKFFDFPGKEEMFAKMGFGKEVEALRKAWLESGFTEATKQVSDEMLEHLPNIAATSLNEVRRKLRDYADSGATRLILVYVPSTESPAEEMMRFLEEW